MSASKNSAKLALKCVDDNHSFSIARTIRASSFTLPSEETLFTIQKYILGKHYTLSITYIGETLSKKLNGIYRKKYHATNVLAFPLSKTSGEIFLTIPYIAREAEVKYGHSSYYHTLYLYIHGCLHLKGYVHGKKMEREEEFIYQRFANLPKNNKNKVTLS